MNLSAPRLGPARISAETLVLAGRTLRPGAIIEDTARFSDVVWRLGPAQRQQHHQQISIDFTNVPEGFREIAKQVTYTLLRADRPPGCESIKAIATVKNLAGQLGAVLRWIDNRGLRSISAITPDDFRAFQQHVNELRLTEGIKSHLPRAFRLLWLCRAHLDDPLAFDPASALDTPRSRHSPHGRENETARIPEQIHAPLLVWAMRWVDDFALDVLRAGAEWHTLQRPSAVPGQHRQRSQPDTRANVAAISRVIARYRSERRALPAYQGTVNLSHLRREANLGRSVAGPTRPAGAVVSATVTELGVDDDTYLRAPIDALLDGQPWRGRIRYAELEELTRMLYIACYIVIIYLSGMRDSEVKHLQRGCVSVWRDDTREVARLRIAGLAFKGERDATGVDATWVVTAPAQRAVAVLERLQPATEKYLFALPPTSRRSESPRPNHVKSTAATNRDLADFVAWIDKFCRERGRRDRIPEVNGAAWKLSSRQFRRTLAWYIARRPGGSIAGALQYRHVRVQMFEGYAGTSQSGFRDEVEAEDAIARGDKLADLITNPDLHRLTGPAAAEAERRFAEFERHVRFDGTVVNDAKRMQRHMARHDPHIYPGEFVTCVHNPDRALCRRSDRQDGPSLPDCQPLRCRNAAITPHNRQRMEEALQSYDRELADTVRLGPYVRHRLQLKRSEIAEFLADQHNVSLTAPCRNHSPVTPTSGPRWTPCLPSAKRRGGEQPSRR
ncbi:hypothetical protein [Rhodococcus sp. H29-C3]|uniref:hypothetical protein n=1 Tax=Rhodococcus sp. H29-C3 TaxID=3046307 RepID=UPI0024B8E287|nr:hypothetical protein [Rhodococcus sp. H29-C3]MDJ0363105.1 hypothetical protein [Rhodococcus sp. H29-C3]